jgi:hypothetical protein
LDNKRKEKVTCAALSQTNMWHLATVAKQTYNLKCEKTIIHLFSLHQTEGGRGAGGTIFTLAFWLNWPVMITTMP